MGEDRILETRKDYEVPLLRLLDELPRGQGKATDVCDLFFERYDHIIPPEHRETMPQGAPVWRYYLRWCRQDFKKYGLLDASRRGIWQISDAGRRWVIENPDAKYVTGAPRRRSRKPQKTTNRKPFLVPGVTLEMLKQTRKLMPADEFRQVWGVLYDQLLAEERAKAITKITQTELGRRTRRWLDDVHAFLGGQVPSSPAAEVVCDWIHLCYALELYREAAALLAYVRKEEIDPASYKRARRVGDVCRAKLVGKAPDGRPPLRGRSTTTIRVSEAV